MKTLFLFLAGLIGVASAQGFSDQQFNTYEEPDIDWGDERNPYDDYHPYEDPQYVPEAPEAGIEERQMQEEFPVQEAPAPRFDEGSDVFYDDVEIYEDEYPGYENEYPYYEDASDYYELDDTYDPDSYPSEEYLEDTGL